MKQIQTQRRITFFVLILLLALLASNLISDSFRATVLQVFSPMQSIAWNMGKTVSGVFPFPDVSQQNEMLQQENLELRFENTALQNALLENEELKNALQLQEESEFSLAAGRIVGKSIGEDRILVRMGPDVDVRQRMPVVTAQGVAVGTVGRVLGSMIEILLLSHPDSSVDAKVSGGRGIIRGEGRFQITLHLLPREIALQAGDTVATSIGGGLFPDNYLIGTVSAVEKKDTEPFQKAFLSPFFSLESSEIVFVITNFLSP
ncbi:MAG: rod shape-determining protein MreC [Candidatus Yanofskybacteria bacterium]|nr:rod shape-determining protein MreC [Candidatus Yanofskybacteria bacterium]